jgi:hypothetical protein
MTLEELTRIVRSAGGGMNALDYADALLSKVNFIAETKRFSALLDQFSTAREAGDFRGRVLEVNFAELFEQNGQDLIYGARQGMSGDIDFLWNVVGRQVFIEMKLLGLDRDTKSEMNRQFERFGASALRVEDDLRDVVRLQRDIIQKATPRKFNPKPTTDAVNVVAVDVSELQLGTVDIADCLLAAGGNPIVTRHYDLSHCRKGVLGVFEPISSGVDEEQRRWATEVHKVSSDAVHPREYIHAAMFLFREPQETAALCYDLKATIVWNAGLVSREVAQDVGVALHAVIPAAQR